MSPQATRSRSLTLATSRVSCVLLDGPEQEPRGGCSRSPSGQAAKAADHTRPSSHRQSGFSIPPKRFPRPRTSTTRAGPRRPRRTTARRARAAPAVPRSRLGPGAGPTRLG